MSVISAVQGLRDEIASRLNEAETDNTDQYNNWVNLALRDIQVSFPNAPWLQTSADRTLSSGTRVYTNLPSDFEKMNDIVYPAANIKLTYLSPEEFNILRPSATDGGNPALYTLHGWGSNAEIWFYPQPGGSYTLHYDYERAINTVSAGSAIPDLPTKYFDLLILYGESRGLRRRGRLNESQQVNQEYESLKEKMYQDLVRQTTEAQRIRNTREYRARQYNDPIRNAFWSNFYP